MKGWRKSSHIGCKSRTVKDRNSFLFDSSASLYSLLHPDGISSTKSNNSSKKIVKIFNCFFGTSATLYSLWYPNGIPATKSNDCSQEIVSGSFFSPMSEPDVMMTLFVVAKLLDNIDQVLIEPWVVWKHLGNLVVVVLGHQSLHLCRMSNSSFWW